MGSSNISYYNNAYQGSLTEDKCKELDYYIELNNKQGIEKPLLHCIYNMNDSDVDDFIEDMENYGRLQREYEKPIGTLSDYQTIGVAFGFTAGNYINGDSVGTGKTVETAGIYNVTKSLANKQGFDYKCLMLTEKTLVSQFRTEMVKFTGTFFQACLDAESKTLDKFIANNPYSEPLKYDVVGSHALIKAPKFLAWLEQCRIYGKGFPFHTLVVDESSLLGGKSTTQVVKSFKAISKYFKKIIFLNATPFETNLNIFYNQLDLLDPKLLPTKTQFQSQYCVMRWMGSYKKPTGKYKNTEKFKELIRYYYFARTRRDNGAEMKNCKGGIIYSELSEIQKYWLPRTQLNRVVFDCPNYLDSSIEFCMENVPKLYSLSNLLNNEAADEDTILIFTYFKEAQKVLSEWLTNQGYSNKILNGDTKQKERDSIIRGFKNAEYRILITNVQKGLNFGSCNFCIFYSFDPNPSKMIQFEGRTTRSFDIENKNVYILCSRGQEEKTLLNVVKARAKATTDLTNTDLSVVLSVLLNTGGNDVNDDDGYFV